MALKIAHKDIARMADQARRMKERARGIQAKADEAVSTVVRTAEVGAAAFGLGVVQGKYGAVEILGVPLDLAVGLGAHGCAFLGLGGKSSSHLHGFGDGAMAAYLTTLGRGTGVNWKRKDAGKALEGNKAATVKGLPSDRLSDNELKQQIAGAGKQTQTA